MDTIALHTGYFVIVGALFVLTFCMLCIVGYVICCLWESFSEKFRDICRTESLIREYKVNREKYFMWRYEVWKEGQTDGK